VSMDRCAECGMPVDTDDGELVYGEDGDEDCVCMPCRYAAVEAQEEDHRLDDPRHGQAEELNKCR